ncbi:bifunctional glutamate N-acetyltransferase/amino-acid acetyltransferase ArgJ [Kaarinaea lacus]
MTEQPESKQKILSEVQAMQPVEGVRLGTAATNVRYSGRDDVLLIEISDSAQAAFVFTQNDFCAAPVIVGKQHMANTRSRYLLVNAGNANAGTGEQGIIDARLCCESLASIVGCEPEQVIPFSTGVIGEHLAVDRITNVFPAAVAGLKPDNWVAASMAIMTTDTVPKGVSRSCNVDGHKITVTGIAKGAGMIQPNMATLLSYIATDAGMTRELLQTTLQQLADQTFNRITVDGDTSTNDSCALIATGESSLPLIDSAQHPAYAMVKNLLYEVFEYLAVSIIRDAEGASKLINVIVSEGKNIDECELVAYTVANSPLVKTALFASDPNWGRILAAIGRAGVQSLDISKIKIDINGVCIVSNGARDKSYTEEAGSRAMKEEEIDINIQLGRGSDGANVWTCDLSYDYIKINAEYRS